jgi:propionyl-CoA carboxylase beta chain
MKEAIKRYREIQEKNPIGGGMKHVERQHKRGKLTARERIDVLIDPGTFNELGSAVGTTSQRIDGRIPEAPCDGAVVGTGEVNGRLTMVYASDFTVLGGSTGTQHLMKFARCLEMAKVWGIPMVNLLDSSGGRLGYQDVATAGVDWHFRIQARYSGVIPQITVLMGPCIAGGAYLPTLCDFLLMSRISANMWLGGPRQTQAATSEKGPIITCSTAVPAISWVMTMKKRSKNAVNCCATSLKISGKQCPTGKTPTILIARSQNWPIWFQMILLKPTICTRSSNSWWMTVSTSS